MSVEALLSGFADLCKCYEEVFRTLGKGGTGSAAFQLAEDEDVLKLDHADGCPDSVYTNAPNCIF